MDEPGADLAVALAVASAVRGVALGAADGQPLACFGELGLTGELRSVAHADRRLAEAAKIRPGAGDRAGSACERSVRRSHRRSATGGERSPRERRVLPVHKR